MPAARVLPDEISYLKMIVRRLGFRVECVEFRATAHICIHMYVYIHYLKNSITMYNSKAPNSS